MRSMARKFAIPPTTLHDHLLANPRNLVLEVPRCLPAIRTGKALTCTNLADMSYGLNREVVGGIVRDYLHENTSKIYSRMGPWKGLVAEVLEAVAMHRR